MCLLRPQLIYAQAPTGQRSRVIREDVEEGSGTGLRFVCVHGGGLGGLWGDVKGTHAQTQPSPGSTVARSSPLFNCQGRGRRPATVAREPFIMGQFVVVLPSAAVNATHHHIRAGTADGRYPSGQIVI